VLSRTVDGPEVVATRVKEVFRFLDKSRLMLNPDCGFAPAHNNPVSMDEAYLKLKSISAAAKRLREETL